MPSKPLKFICSGTKKYNKEIKSHIVHENKKKSSRNQHKSDEHGMRYLHQRTLYYDWHNDRFYQYHQTSVETGHSIHVYRGWDPS